ncbi:MAG: S-layer protein [Candidatus Diapherotrites archaeon]|nr:S-layer protein [Candidatus Diapherotrites archaeon]
MKKLNVKKLAAVGAGAALVGMAVAPIVSAALTPSEVKSAVYDASGSPLVNVVVGSEAATSDAIWAGNIVRKIVEKATTTGTVTVQGSGPGGALGTAEVTDLSVDLTIGGTVTYENAKLYDTNYLDSRSGGTSFEYKDKQNGKSQLDFFADASKTYTWGSSAYTLTVKELAGTDLDAKFDTSTVIKDLVGYLSTGDFNYWVDLSPGIPVQQTTTNTADFTDGSNDDIRIPFFGKDYLVQSISTGGDASIDSMKLILDKGKQTFTAGESFKVKGKGSQVGKDLTVTVVNVVATGPAATSYSGTFQLTDDAGTVIDSVTSASAAFITFRDDKGQEVVDGDIYADTIATTSGTNEAYVQLLIGGSTIQMFDGKGYPYVSSQTSGWDWQVTLDENTAAVSSPTSRLFLRRILISNVIGNKVYKSVYDNTNPLYSDDSVSAAAKTGGKEAVFLGGTGVPGDGYFSLAFDGFKNDKAYTTVKIGANALEFRDSSSQYHKIPFWIGLSTATNNTGDGSTFTFDNGIKTMYYKVSTTDVNFDLNITAAAANDNLDGVDANFNLKNCTITTDFGLADMNTQETDLAGPGADFNAGIGQLNRVVIHGISYVPGGCTPLSGYLQADGNFSIATAAINSSTTSTDYLTGVNGTAPARNTWYYNDGITDLNESLQTRNAVRFPLAGDAYYVGYTYYAKENDNKLYFLLDSNSGSGRIPLGSSGTGQTIEYAKNIQFAGTDINEGLNGMEYSFYWPDKIELGTSTSGTATGPNVGVSGNVAPGPGVFGGVLAGTAPVTPTASDNSFMTAVFRVDENEANLTAAGGYPIAVYIRTDTDQLHTLPNTNLTAPTSDLNFTNGMNLQSFSLDLAGNSSSMTKAVTDFGSTLDITTESGRAIVSMPQDQTYLQWTLKGQGTKTVASGGETLSIKEGESAKTGSGTSITVDKVNYTATVVGGDGEASGVVAVPSEYTTPAPLNNNAKVYTDDSAPAGKKVVVGGPLVNSFATSVADQLNSSGDYVALVVGSDIIVAGYNAQDTGTAAQELINALDAVQ